jgi:hypothetical protein
MMDAVATWLSNPGLAVTSKWPFIAAVPTFGEEVAKAVAERMLMSEAAAIETSFVAAATEKDSLLCTATPPVA